MTVTIKLPPVYDLSKWDPVINWDILSPRPDLIITRATYGDALVDAYYAECALQARNRGYAFWAYGFLLYVKPWQAQADLFIRTVLPGMTGDFVPVLDIEGSLPAGVSQSTANGMIENWLTRVEAALARTCVIYSSRNYLSKLYSTTPPAWLKARELWIAGYPTNPDTLTSMPASYVPVGVPSSQVILWQYSASGVVTGITSAVDLNQYQSGFRAVQPSAPAPPPVLTLEGRVAVLEADVRQLQQIAGI